MCDALTRVHVAGTLEIIIYYGTKKHQVITRHKGARMAKFGKDWGGRQAGILNQVKEKKEAIVEK